MTFDAMLKTEMKSKVYMASAQNPQIGAVSSESTNRGSFTEISILEVELGRQSLPGVHHPLDLQRKVQVTPAVAVIKTRLQNALAMRKRNTSEMRGYFGP